LKYDQHLVKHGCIYNGIPLRKFYTEQILVLRSEHEYFKVELAEFQINCKLYELL